MRRVSTPPRPNWREQVEACGLDFHTIDGAPYWDETAYWRFAMAEIDRLEEAAEHVHALCLEAVDHVIAQDRFAELGISARAADWARESWRRGDPSLCGRFDFAWDGSGEPKMLEYNADTPTSLFEASVVQWQWLQDFAPQADQFNSLHEALVERWPALVGDRVLHLTCPIPHAEDEGHVRYMQATALEAGLTTKFIALEDIGWDG